MAAKKNAKKAPAKARKAAKLPGRRAAKLPGRAAKLPGRAAKLPGRAAKLPGRAAKLPGRAAKLPGRAAKLPGRAAKLPGRAAKLPGRRAAKLPGKKHTPHPVVHWEIQAVDARGLVAFYANAFGWEINSDNPMNYGMVASGGPADSINGGIGASPHGASRVVVYASVPDIDEALERIGRHGGKTIMPRTDVGPVIMALYADPEGNVMGLVEA